MKIKQLFFGSFLPLILGCSIYFLFRSLTLKMFCWFSIFGFDNFIYKMRIITNKIQLPNWVLYVLPDGLWLFSFMSLQFFIWKNEIKKNNLIWIISLPILAICSEIGQFFKFIPGTFDVLDLLVYLIGTFFPFIVYKNQLIFKVN